MTDLVPVRKIPSVFDQIREMQDRIMQRAYEIFEHNGHTLGRDFENWTQAEREIMWQPAIELREKDGQYLLDAAISGLEAKDINIEVTPEDIVLSAEVRHESTEQKGTIHYSDFQQGRMFRSIHLPKKIDTDKVRAEYKNGLLRLTAEIAQEARVKKIKPEAA
jgi:HSP20 family molecular chaperone IbpA